MTVVRSGAAGGAMTQLMEVIDHRFDDPALLEQAVTHPSASSPARPDNQRLEFLGDRVLGLIIAEALLQTYPGEAEGILAPRFNALVRREALAEIASEIALGGFLHLGRSEATSGGRKKKAILADAMEAVIAALFLDGGMAVVRRFILGHWQGRIDAPGEAPMDAKTRLQEWVQGRGMETPAYEVTGREGPDHAPRFAVEVRIGTGDSAAGQASSKKQAEQNAAGTLLRHLGVPGGDDA